LLIEIEAREAVLAEVEQALHTLVSQGRIEVKEIAGQRWYTMVVRRLGFPEERR
jgi:cell division FtsZ-interacting protein ZapD